MFKIKNISIEIKFSFFICLLLMIALNFTEQFFILFFVVLVHEAAHVFAAKLFGLKTSRIIITPAGQAALINGLETVYMWQEIVVLLAGAAVNLLLSCLSFVLIKKVNFFVSVNLITAVFNFLPFYPLDGGRIVFSVVSRKISIIGANRIAVRTGRAFGWLLVVLGSAQMVLYPFNFSLFLVGCYLVKKNKDETIGLDYHFFRQMTEDNAKDSFKRRLRQKRVAAGLDTKLLSLVKLITWDTECVFIVSDKEFGERQLFVYIKNGGLNGCVAEVVKYFDL